MIAAHFVLPKMSDAPVLKTLITDGVLLGAATALGYMTSYSYELGFFSHFKLPTEFISLNLTTVLSVATAFLVFFGSTFNLIGFAGPLLRAGLNPKNYAYHFVWLMLFLAALSVIVFRYAYGWGWRGTLFASIVAGTLILLFFLPTLLFQRKKPLRQRFEELVEANENDPFDIHTTLQLWWKPRTIALCTIPLVVLTLAWILGNGDATTKTRYLTIANSPNTVVLRAYGDLLISAKFSRESREVGEEVSILWLAEKKEVSFFNEEVGPLSLKPALRDLKLK